MIASRPALPIELLPGNAPGPGLLALLEPFGVAGEAVYPIVLVTTIALPPRRSETWELGRGGLLQRERDLELVRSGKPLCSWDRTRMHSNPRPSTTRCLVLIMLSLVAGMFTAELVVSGLDEWRQSDASGDPRPGRAGVYESTKLVRDDRSRAAVELVPEATR